MTPPAKKKKKLSEIFKQGLQQFFQPNDSNLKKALSLGHGVFWGLTPFHGFQILIAMALSIPLKANKALTLLGLQISLPPFLPFFIYLSVKAGEVLFQEKSLLSFKEGLDVDGALQAGKLYVAGSLVISVIFSLIAIGSSYLILSIKKNQKEKLL